MIRMHNQLARLGIVVLGTLAQSCGPVDSDPHDPHATGGKAGNTGAVGGASSGSSGASSAGAGGAPVSGAGGAPAAGSGAVPEAGAGGVSAAGSGGASGTGGDAPGGTGGQSGGGGGGSGDIWGGLKNPPGKSPGCGKPAAVMNGKKTIMSGGMARSYIIDIPANYDVNKPYRLFYASHGLGGSADEVASWNYYELKREAAAANEPAVFIAPQGIDGRWEERDHALFDDITTFAKESLCIDTTRVFVTGMSFGGMITYSLSTNHQKRFRAGVALAPANYNVWLPNPKATDPIAWMHTTGMSDNTCPWDAGDGRGSKYIALEKAADNGCTAPATIPTWQSGKHLCYDFEGCKAGYPVKVCTFNGGHVQTNSDPGTNTNWIAQESWKFFMQF
jgi:poly(3-hydroxybutyrate) depolymerase